MSDAGRILDTVTVYDKRSGYWLHGRLQKDADNDPAPTRPRIGTKDTRLVKGNGDE